MADPKQFKQLTSINHGTTAESNIKMLDYVPMQHENNNPGVNTLNKLRFAQLLCQPYAEAGAIGSNNTYNATCSNFPDFNVKYQENGVDHYFVGLKVRVKFANGITYGSTSSPVTYPLLNINNTEAFPILAQGKTVGAGAASAGQTLEFTLIRYGNDGYAWDADSNVRESTSDYTIYTDGSKKYNSAKQIINDYVDIVRFSATRTQRDVFYVLRDKYALADSNGALAYVIGNVNGTPFNNIYQNNGVRYFRNDSSVVYQVQWNQDVATGKVITILFSKIV